MELPKQILRKTQTDPCGANFGSVHENLLVVFCVGSVHAINFDISKAAWARIYTSGGGYPT